MVPEDDPAVRVCVVDIETRSLKDLAVVGGRNYCADCEILCLVALLDGEYTVWTPFDVPLLGGMVAERGPTVPDRLLREAAAGTVFVAHNAHQFDALVLARYGLRPQQWVDTLPLARRRGLPGGLDRIGRDLYGRGKTEGKKAMLLLSKPTKKGAYVEPTPQTLSACIQYCKDDVDLTARLWLDEIEPHLVNPDNAVMLLDRKINDRGVAFDSRLARTLLILEQDFRRKELAHIRDVAGVEKGVLTSPQRLQRWLAGFGIRVPDTEAGTIKALCQHPHTPAAVKMVLWGRMGQTRIAAAKLARAVDLRCADGRLRDTLAYHAASTGRWGGRGFQPQNLPRPVELPPGTAERILNGESQAIADAARGGVTVDDVLATMVRSCIIPTPGRVFGAVDFSAVEARVLCWLAGDEAGLDVFRSNKDVYKHFATYLYGVPYEQVTKVRRNASKPPVLGCVAEGTDVLVNGAWQPIETVKPGDWVWDGEGWVKTEGAVFRGYKRCTVLRGVWLTEDHEVLLRSQEWVPQGDLGNGRYLASGRCLAAERSWKKLNPPLTAGNLKFDANAAGSRSCESRLCTAQSCVGVRGRAVNIQKSLAMLKRGEGFYARSSVFCADARTPPTRRMPTTAGGESAYGRLGNRIEVSSSAISFRFPVGMTQLRRLIGLTTTKGTNQEIFVALTARSRRGIEELTGRLSIREESGARWTFGPGLPLDIEKLLSWPGKFAKGKPPSRSSESKRTVEARTVKTYDLLNCGPRLRFVVRGDRPFICHNCGFQMSHDRLASYAAGMGIDLAAAGIEARQAVEMWRDLHPPIAGERTGRMWDEHVLRQGGLWRHLHGGVRQVVERTVPEAHIGRCWWRMEDKHLLCRLPSGRDLIYRNCSVDLMPSNFEEGQLVLQVAYDNARGGSTARVGTYGGKFCENITQATARDLLAAAMLRVDAAGFDVVLSIHDELLVELDDVKDVQRLAELMAEPPGWARGLPIGVEGFAAPRYAKEAPEGWPTAKAEREL